MKKNAVLLFGFMTVFSLWSCSSDDLLDVSSVNTEDVLMASVDDSFEKAQKLIDFFRPKVTRSESITRVDYPDYFGGCFIDKDGMLKVLIKGDFNDNARVLASAVGSDGVVYEKCLYSRNELMDLKQQIADYMINNKYSSVALNLDYVSYSCKQNKIIVGLKDCSDTNVRLFKEKVLDSAPLIFVESDNENLIQSDVASGQSIYSGGLTASVGYKANYSGYTGFVTAAHFVGSGDDVYLGSNHSTKIATCMVAMYQGTVDAAFCSMESGWYMNVGVYGNSSVNVSQYEGATVEGSWVKKYGYNGYTEGYVVDESYDTWASGVYMMDLARTTYASVSGDSGGLILSQTNGYVMGIHQSGTSTGGNYCKVGNINYMLGTTLATW